MSVVLVERDGGVATVTMARPGAMNALNMELKEALADAFQQLADDPSVRCVVLTGEGKGFSAGGDIREMELNDVPVRSRSRLQVLLRETVEPLLRMEKPTIAAVNGHAHGAGLSLALACDVIFAADNAVMSCAFTKLGLVPDCGALYLLPRRVGLSRAKDLVFSGRRFDAAQALAMGAVDEVVAAGDLVATAQTRAAEYAAGPTVALGLAKHLLDQSLNSSWSAMTELEPMAQAVCYSTDDHQTARQAFLAKTAPSFTGS